MGGKKKDWIALLEAAYNLDGTPNSWLQDVLDRSAPLFDRGIWPTIMTYEYSPTNISINRIASKGPSFAATRLKQSIYERPEAVDLIYSGKLGQRGMALS